MNDDSQHYVFQLRKGDIVALCQHFKVLPLLDEEFFVFGRYDPKAKLEFEDGRRYELDWSITCNTCMSLKRLDQMLTLQICTIVNREKLVQRYLELKLIRQRAEKARYN